MNKLLTFLSVILIFFSCSSQKKIVDYKVVDMSELEVDKVYYEKWIAGVKGGGSGINLYINHSLFANDITLKKVYFKDRYSDFEKNEDYYIARFRLDLNQLRDYVMDSDSAKEVENELPESIKNEVLNLGDNDALITIIKASVESNIIIKNITQKETIPYPLIKK